jgi:DNA-binding beta-propeller fold protein YncE
MLAIMNYETKAEESLEALALQSGPTARREGIMIMEMDPSSADYGKVLMDIPLDPELVTHHIFYNKDLTKAYVTALAKETLHVIDLTKYPYRLKPIPTPGCQVQEDIILSDDNKTWYLTCMGSQNVIVGDAVADKAIQTIAMPGSFPHGIGLHEGIDRILVTSCVSPDMSAVGYTLEVIEASTGKHLGGIPMSEGKGSAPVEVVFVPRTDPPVAYVTNMMEDTLGAAVWNPATETFDIQTVFDFNASGANMPLEIYFNAAVDRLYVTTAQPGNFFIFDISDGPLAPKMLKKLDAAGGAHHVAITPDGKTAYVQNSLLNIPGISDGSITVVDLEAQEVIGSIDTLKEQNLTPNSLTFMPAWYNQMGHFNNGPGE